jgi:hypothetical protein
VAEGGALAHWLPDVEKNEANAFVCVYLMVQLLELEPSFSLFHSVLQTFGHFILHIHRCRTVTGTYLQCCGSESGSGQIGIILADPYPEACLFQPKVYFFPPENFNVL